MKSLRSISNIFNIVIFLFLQAFFLPFFFACAFKTEDAYVFNKSEYVYISLDFKNLVLNSSIVNRNTSERTILPDSIDLSDTSKYNYYIWGKSKTESLSPRLVDIDFSTSSLGTIVLDFPATSYTFVLVAIEGSPDDITSGAKLLEDAILIGYTNADLAYTNSIKFYMAPNNLPGYGNVTLSLLLDASWTDNDVIELNSLTDGLLNYDITADLYDINNGALVYSSIESPIYGLNKSTPVIFSHVRVSSGVYNFTIKFKKRGNTIAYNYSDRIIIYSNQNTNSTFFIPNVIEKIPAAPTEFKAAYCTDSPLYEKTLGSEASYSNYGLLLKWKDNSNNESHFKITLADISKTATAIESVPSPETFTDSDWNNIVGPYLGNKKIVHIYDDTYTQSQDYFAGSPEKNNTMLVLLIPFDGCYIAKIEAVNDAGISEACYATINEDFNLQISEDIFNIYNSFAELNGHAFRTSENNTCNVINLYHIVYYLCGGEYFYLKNTETTKLPIVDYVVYGMNKEIRCPCNRKSEATVSSPALILNDSRWNAWTVNCYNGDLFPSVVDITNEGHTYQKPNNYTGYISLYLFARYD